jgi:glycosyltransferase involved in cell wall biosynthesis
VRNAESLGAPKVLYLSGVLPARSETFVYREIFALRGLGVTIITASVHAPQYGLGTHALGELAAATITVYGRGWLRIVLDAAMELGRRPGRTLNTLLTALGDATAGSDIRLSDRPKVLWQGLAALSLARQIRPRGVVHIHAHMANVPTAVAMYAARQLSITFSFTGHANDVFASQVLLREKLKRAAWVNCISYWHRAFYVSIVRREESDYPIVRCGVDTSANVVNPPPRRQVLEILAVGRLVPKKGFDILIAALGDIARAGGLAMRARIAGGGEEEGNLRRQIASLPAGASVELLGELTNEDVIGLMGDCDLFVIPCRVTETGDRDGIPVVLMEAMACGRCVIAGDLVTIRELVRDGDTGIMIPSEDQAALAEVLQKLANNRDDIDAFGRRARAWVEQEFDLMVNARRILRAMETHNIFGTAGRTF